MDYTTVNLLLVDDDRIDVLALKRALEQNKIANPIFTASDGVQALRMLRGEEGEVRVPWPYIILLDLNMPRMNGIEFLRELRADPMLHRSVVFVLTTSKADQDKAAAYDQHVAGYLVKSEVGSDFLKLIRLIDQFRLLVQFPVG